MVRKIVAKLIKLAWRQNHKLFNTVYYYTYTFRDHYSIIYKPLRYISTYLQTQRNMFSYNMKNRRTNTIQNGLLSINTNGLHDL